MKIDHVAMYVKDLENTKSFFEKYFGAISNVKDLENTKSFFEKYFGAISNDGYHNKNTNFRSYFLSFENGSRLEIMNKPDMNDEEKSVARTGFIHIAFSVGSKEKVDELTSQLKADGYEVLSGPRTTGDGYYESCIIDLENNQIEITVWISTKTITSAYYHKS